MSLLDKVGTIAKSATDKAGETIEITKLNAKISSQRDKITNTKKSLGDFYYQKFSAGEELDPAALEYCNQIKEHENEIENLQAQIQSVKNS